jgi:hypothetical protein
MREGIRVILFEPGVALIGSNDFKSRRATRSCFRSRCVDTQRVILPFVQILNKQLDDDRLIIR